MILLLNQFHLLNAQKSIFQGGECARKESCLQQNAINLG